MARRGRVPPSASHLSSKDCFNNKAESEPEQGFYCYCGLYIVVWLRTSDWHTRLLSSTVSRRRQCALMEEIIFYRLYYLSSLCVVDRISPVFSSLFRVESFEVRIVRQIRTVCAWFVFLPFLQVSLNKVRIRLLIDALNKRNQ